MLNALTAQAAQQGRLVVPPEQAAAHVLATNIGVTLRQISVTGPDPELSAAVRDGVIQAVTGVVDHPLADNGRSLTEYAAANPGILGDAETGLFIDWARRLSMTDGHDDEWHRRH